MGKFDKYKGKKDPNALALTEEGRHERYRRLAQKRGEPALVRELRRRKVVPFEPKKKK